ncbi:MAG: hypothetical protein VYE03_02250 [Nitrospinota bacterium]|nr:hypothetical protein [Nitrospinota bacterium]
MSDSKIPEDGVSGKLKLSVYILTGITLFAFVAFFTKLITKERIPNKQEKKIEKPSHNGIEKSRRKFAGKRFRRTGSGSVH